jgi:hypothetical protein
VNAILAPPGVNAGESSFSVLLVRRVCPVPSLFITQMSPSVVSEPRTQAILPERASWSVLMFGRGSKYGSWPRCAGYASSGDATDPARR